MDEPDSLATRLRSIFSVRSAHLWVEAPTSAFANDGEVDRRSAYLLTGECTHGSGGGAGDVDAQLLADDVYTYLTRQVAAGDAGLSPQDSLVAYYESTGSPPGRWAGRGLNGLGSDASGRLRPGAMVTESVMAAVFRDGRDPLTSDGLGRIYQDQTRRSAVGFDLTFTVPKSVSVRWALGDEPTRAAVHAAHRAALVSRVVSG